MDKVKEIHNTASTSRDSFKIINENGSRQREKAWVLAAIEYYQPCTSRMLANKTGIERGNITRSLFDLVNDTPPKIKVACIKKCEITNRNVQHYSLVDWKE